MLRRWLIACLLAGPASADPVLFQALSGKFALDSRRPGGTWIPEATWFLHPVQD